MFEELKLLKSYFRNELSKIKGNKSFTELALTTCPVSPIK